MIYRKIRLYVISAQRLVMISIQIKGTQKAAKTLLMIIRKLMPLYSLRLTELAVRIIRPFTGPVMIRPEINIFLPVTHQRIIQRHRLYLTIHFFVYGMNGFLLIRRINL